MLSAVNKPTRNRIQESTGRKAFRVVNVIVLILLALICLLPFVNVIALSFSDSFYVDIQYFFKFRKNIPFVIRCLEHKDMIVAGRTYQTVALVHKRIRTLYHIAAAIMLFW